MIEKEVFKAVRGALTEDIGKGDLTTDFLITKPRIVAANIIAKEPGVLAGIFVAMSAFKLLDQKIKFMPLVVDGKAFKKDTVVASIEGDMRSILTSERTALNFLSHLSGIATLTSKFVKEVKPHKVKIIDTRKTTPGLRALEKYAVASGGGCNHRMGLYDQILIKDNHLKAIKYDWKLVAQTVRNARTKKIISEIEVENISQFKEALKCRPDIIMLDNMPLKEINRAVKLRDFLSPISYLLSPKLEVSGGISLDNVRGFAATGIDMISVGALTHSARPIDFSLDVLCQNSNSSHPLSLAATNRRQ